MKPADNPIELAKAGWDWAFEWDKLTPEDITKYDEKGLTFLHYIAKNGKWDNLPTHLQDKKYWREGKDGETIYMSAFRGFSVGWIKEGELDEAEILKTNKKGESIATIAAQTRQFNKLFEKLFAHNVTKAVLTQKYMDNAPKDHDECIIHLIASENDLKYIPQSVLTEDLLSLKGRDGNTVYHILAQGCQIHLLPKETLTKKALTIENDAGASVLYRLAENQAELIPEELLTPELFCKVSKDKESPLQAWARSGKWDLIPDHLLTKESLSIGNSVKETPIHHILKKYDSQLFNGEEIKATQSKKISRILSLVNIETLEALKDAEEKSLNRLGFDLESITWYMQSIKKELSKRKIVKKLSGSEQSLNI